MDKASCVERFLNVSRATLSWDSTQQRKHPLWKVVNFNEVRICITTGCPQSLGIYGFSLSMWKCGLWKAHVLGPFFFDEHVTGETYLIMLRDKLMPQIEHLGEGLPDWFHQDGAPAYFAKAVRDWLNDNFPSLDWKRRSCGVGPSFTRPFSHWLLFLGYVKRESVLDEDYRFKLHERRHYQSVCWNQWQRTPIPSSSPKFCKAHPIMHWKRWKLC